MSFLVFEVDFVGDGNAVCSSFLALTSFFLAAFTINDGEILKSDVQSGCQVLQKHRTPG